MKILSTLITSASGLLKFFAAGEASAEEAAKRQTVVFETSAGDFKIELYNDLAPKTVKNFTDLIEKKYYDGIIFHRVIDNFMIDRKSTRLNSSHT